MTFQAQSVVTDIKQKGLDNSEEPIADLLLDLKHKTYLFLCYLLDHCYRSILPFKFVCGLLIFTL